RPPPAGSPARKTAETKTTRRPRRSAPPADAAPATATVRSRSPAAEAATARAVPVRRALPLGARPAPAVGSGVREAWSFPAAAVGGRCSPCDLVRAAAAQRGQMAA